MNTQISKTVISAAAVLLLMPFYGLVVVILSERLVLVGRSWSSWRGHSHGALLEQVRRERKDVVHQVATLATYSVLSVAMAGLFVAAVLRLAQAAVATHSDTVLGRPRWQLSLSV